METKEQPQKHTAKTAAADLQAAPLAQADADLRNHFAGIVLREIVVWQLANKRATEEDVAASWAYRYADRMLEQSKKAPRGPAIRVKGVAAAPELDPILPPGQIIQEEAKEILGGMVPSK